MILKKKVYLPSKHFSAEMEFRKIGPCSITNDRQLSVGVAFIVTSWKTWLRPAEKL
jgi:hypothetical protein